MTPAGGVPPPVVSTATFSQPWRTTIPPSRTSGASLVIACMPSVLSEAIRKSPHDPLPDGLRQRILAVHVVEQVVHDEPEVGLVLEEPVADSRVHERVGRQVELLVLDPLLLNVHDLERPVLGRQVVEVDRGIQPERSSDLN